MPHYSTITLGNPDTTGVIINGPDSDQPIETLPEWVTDLTADNTRIVYRPTSSTLHTWKIDCSNITTAQKNALLTFFRDVAKGPTNTFAYRHTDGTTYTVRFSQTSLNFSRQNNEFWSVQLILESANPINS